MQWSFVAWNCLNPCLLRQNKPKSIHKHAKFCSAYFHTPRSWAGSSKNHWQKMAPLFLLHLHVAYFRVWKKAPLSHMVIITGTGSGGTLPEKQGKEEGFCPLVSYSFTTCKLREWMAKRCSRLKIVRFASRKNTRRSGKSLCGFCAPLL